MSRSESLGISGAVFEVFVCGRQITCYRIVRGCRWIECFHSMLDASIIAHKLIDVRIREGDCT